MMTPEMLHRCLSGTASDEEMVLYSHWLNGSPEEEISEPVIPEESLAAQRIWQQIQIKNQHKDRFKKYKFRAIWTSVAASLFIIGYLTIFSSSLFRGFASEDNILVLNHNSSGRVIEKEFEGLLLKLGSNSSVRLQSQKKSNDIDIRFSGNMMLSNPTSKDKYTEIVYTSENGKQITRKVRLKKGTEYVLAYFPLKKEKLLVIENRALRDMPPAFTSHLSQDFDLF